LLAWHRRTGSPECTFLVHGEEEVMSAFSRHLRGTRVEMPTEGQSFTL
jgi:metallo-beta-lactamase family protein